MHTFILQWDWLNFVATYSLVYSFFRMTLLLGPPGSGKTTLLKALAGKPDDDLRVSNFSQGHGFNCFFIQTDKLTIF